MPLSRSWSEAHSWRGLGSGSHTALVPVFLPLALASDLFSFAKNPTQWDPRLMSLSFPPGPGTSVYSAAQLGTVVASPCILTDSPCQTKTLPSCESNQNSNADPPPFSLLLHQ